MKIGVIGYGNYGKISRMIVRRFCDEHDIYVEVLVHEKNMPADGRIFFSLEDLKDCDAVVFAVGMRSFEQAVKDLLAVKGLRKDMILVNVCSEQEKSGAVLAALAPDHPRLCFHTPWGPEAYRLVNQVVSLLPATIITEHAIDRHLADELLAFVGKCGFGFTFMDPEEHDRKIAARWMFPAHLICRLLEKLHLLDGDYSAAPLSVQKIIEGARMLRNDKPLFFDLWDRVKACGPMFAAFITTAHELEEEKTLHATGK
jgi:prephenate dehydrogenase